MALRITSGRFRARALATPSGTDTRPTMERTRAAILSMVTARMFLDGTRVLDLFAGSGALGFEALSRGAARLTAVETDRRALAAWSKNAHALGVEREATVVKVDALAFLDRHVGPPFDLIVADPPYDLPALDTLPDRALRVVDPDGLVVVEHDRRHDFSAHPAFLTSRRHGTTIVSVFRVPGDEGRVSSEEDAEDEASTDAYRPSPAH